MIMVAKESFFRFVNIFQTEIHMTVKTGQQMGVAQKDGHSLLEIVILYQLMVVQSQMVSNIRKAINFSVVPYIDPSKF